jgi:hypothetical protein
MSELLHTFRRKNLREKAATLVVTLLVLTLLSTIVVAFVQTVSLERSAARSVANRYQAELAAQAGASVAASQLARLFQTYPDSATAWLSLTSGTFSNSFTAAFYRRNPTTDIGTSPSEPNSIWIAPLFSGGCATVQSSADLAALSGNNTMSPSNFFNFNSNTNIGLSPGNATAQPMQGAWVEILKNPTQPRNLNRGPDGQPINPPVARYAYWVEDESFKVDLSEASATPRSDNTPGTNSSDVSLTPWASGFSPGNSNQVASGVLALRSSLGNQTSKALLSGNQKRFAANFPTSTNAIKQADFSSTWYSKTLNLSRGGTKRVSLNEVVSDSTDAAQIRAQLDRIIATITNSYNCPNFGQRFMREGTTSAQLNNTNYITSNESAIYLQKVAANIRDYIDSDSQPTVISNSIGFPVLIGAKPLVAPGFSVVGSAVGTNDIAAFGKESVPALGEAAIRISLITLSPVNANAGNRATGANYQFTLDYYFEFWNPTTKDITLNDLGPSPFLRIYNQFGWETGGGTPLIPQGRPYEVPLSGFVDDSGQPFRIPAGTMVTFTTDEFVSPNLTSMSSLVFRPSTATIATLNSHRSFTGVTKHESGNKYRVQGQLGTSAGRAGTPQSDYDTHVLIGNNLGILEGFSAVVVPTQLTAHNDSGTSLGPNNENFTFRGGALFGNSGGNLSATGDYQSINEQLQLSRYSTDLEARTGFVSTGLDTADNPANSSFGSFNGLASYIRPDFWTDYSQTNLSKPNAPRIIRNGPMASIGEMGNIYDPARLIGSSGKSGARGGGLTFKIGQSDSTNSFTSNPRQSLQRWDGIQTNASRAWAAWRLTDIFSTQTNLSLPGRININGVARDGGYAFSSLFDQLRFTSQTANGTLIGTPTTSDVQLANSLANTNVGVGAVVSAIRNRLNSSNATSANIFWERGEISELPLFSTNSTLTGASMATTLDRGREELIRRSIELLCVKGSVFSIHCVGQALQVNGSTVVPISTVAKKSMVELEPVYNNPLPADSSFTPTSNDRFRRPDSYSIKIIYENTL